MYVYCLLFMLFSCLERTNLMYVYSSLTWWFHKVLVNSKQVHSRNSSIRCVWEIQGIANIHIVGTLLQGVSECHLTRVFNSIVEEQHSCCIAICRDDCLECIGLKEDEISHTTNKKNCQLHNYSFYETYKILTKTRISTYPIFTRVKNVEDS